MTIMTKMMMRKMMMTMTQMLIHKEYWKITPETNLDVDLSAIFGDVTYADKWIGICNS